MQKRVPLVPGIGLLIVLFLLPGCVTRQVNMEQAQYIPPYEEEAPQPPPSPATQPKKKGKKEAAAQAQKEAPAPARKDPPTVRRAVTEKELRKLAERDPELDFYRCLEILSRLNRKDKEYIRDDMKRKRAIIVPKDFGDYKDWSFLPKTLNGIEKIPKFILVVKDMPFLGWYERGRLVGDTYVCVGKMNTWTKRGMYRIKEKDANHMSNYPNAYGEPSFMPMAMRVYDRVWIHAGDVIGPNCSHGCINVPLGHAEKLFDWADIGTVVMITESLKDFGKEMRTGVPPRNQAEPAKSGVKEGAKKTGN